MSMPSEPHPSISLARIFKVILPVAVLAALRVLLGAAAAVGSSGAGGLERVSADDRQADANGRRSDQVCR